LAIVDRPVPVVRRYRALGCRGGYRRASRAYHSAISSR